MKKSELKDAQVEAKKLVEVTNDRIQKLGKEADTLYKALNVIQACFDNIRNVPSEKKLQYQKVREVSLKWKSQADKIKEDYNKAFRKNVGGAATGVSAGIAIATMEPTIAMGVATTFGVASTGTAISTLSGAAATNAALAWLGGGTLAAGGGGMAAGSSVLVASGPIGWTIAGIAVITSGVMFWKSHTKKKILDEIFTRVCKRDTKSYSLAIVELNERIRCIEEESIFLRKCIKKIRGFGLDYTKMSDDTQKELGTYVNAMNASAQLLVNPIKGLQPVYTEEDFSTYIQWSVRNTDNPVNRRYKKAVISLSTLLYAINLNDNEWKVLYESLRHNKDFLESVDLSKKDFSESIIEWVREGLNLRYKKYSVRR